jgi:protein-disulfide isomerase
VIKMQISIRTKLASHSIILLLLLGVGVAHASSSCVAPSPSKIDEVRDFVAKLHDLNADSLKLVFSAASKKGCYWELRFELRSPISVVKAYLSPDRKFVSGEVYDLTLDPLVEERGRLREVADSLTRGSPPSRGPLNAAVTVVEFVDFECPYCASLMKVLEDKMRSGSSVKLVTLNFPLEIHSWARKAAEMGECVALQAEPSYWKFYDFIFTNQDGLSATNIDEKVLTFLRTDPDLDVMKFNACMKQNQGSAKVDKDIELGRMSGVHSTPTFFVNGIPYVGFRDGAQLQQILEAAQRGDVRPIVSAPRALSVPVVSVTQMTEK